MQHLDATSRPFHRPTRRRLAGAQRDIVSRRSQRRADGSSTSCASASTAFGSASASRHIAGNWRRRRAPRLQRTTGEIRGRQRAAARRRRPSPPARRRGAGSARGSRLAQQVAAVARVAPAFAVHDARAAAKLPTSTSACAALTPRAAARRQSRRATPSARQPPRPRRPKSRAAAAPRPAARTAAGARAPSARGAARHRVAAKAARRFRPPPAVARRRLPASADSSPTFGMGSCPPRRRRRDRRAGRSSSTNLEASGGMVLAGGGGVFGGVGVAVRETAESAPAATMSPSRDLPSPRRPTSRRRAPPRARHRARGGADEGVLATARLPRDGGCIGGMREMTLRCPIDPHGTRSVVARGREPSRTDRRARRGSRRAAIAAAGACRRHLPMRRGGPYGELYYTALLYLRAGITGQLREGRKTCWRLEQQREVRTRFSAIPPPRAS